MVIKMNKEVLSKLKNDPKYLTFLRQNSSWYKTLNRNPNSYNDFQKAMKEKYKLTASDKINDISEKLDLLRTFMNVLK